MGETMVIFKVYPEEPGLETEIIEELKKLENCTVQDIKTEPIAFGLVAIRIGVTMPEKQDDLLDKIQEQIKIIKGVKEFEVEGMTLV